LQANLTEDFMTSDALKFEDEFDRPVHAVYISLWATHPQFDRIEFTLTPDIVSEVIGVSPVNKDVVVSACNGQRLEIETACQKAFSDRPGMDIELSTTDFRGVVGNG
jgi:hypothetical protein